MKFVQFQRLVPAGLVFVNPAHVVAVDTFGDNTRIHTTANAKDVVAGVDLFMVAGTQVDAVLKLQAAAD